ncbi:sugar phosphate nucleotidyltransferase [Desulfobulbus alkaliphilus]|uniref:sugar phosphate nucleotidyltransferase n=1 Tax=Desulfobulbus alkaliphilus TaxID=869814 RepID=UPI001963644B|nr:sugar phosphate nucleotidyltransferase [Desulfobulbus alkaliphilus]MBM9537621.1 NTP transferase domain-containing protein [Desulfobulbus alkaliphilus]
MQAIVLAAGYGTRLRPYSTLRPKPLFPVRNRPLLHLLLEQLGNCACFPVLVNCHHLAAQIETALAAWPEVLVQHEHEILGTGGSLRRALDRLDNDPVLVMNGDIYHHIDLEQVYHRHLLSRNEVTLALHDYPRFNQVVVVGDRVKGFRAQPGAGLAFTGIHVIDPEAIERIPAKGYFDIIDLYRQLALEGRVGCYRVDGSLWRDIGTPEDYIQLHAELLADHPGWEIDANARVGRDVVLEGWGCIGPGAVIGDGARLANAVVWEGACIASGRKCREAIITGNATVDGWTGNGVDGKH